MSTNTFICSGRSLSAYVSGRLSDLKTSASCTSSSCAVIDAMKSSTRKLSVATSVLQRDVNAAEVQVRKDAALPARVRRRSEEDELSVAHGAADLQRQLDVGLGHHHAVAVRDADRLDHLQQRRGELVASHAHGSTSAASPCVAAGFGGAPGGAPGGATGACAPTGVAGVAGAAGAAGCGTFAFELIS